MGVSQVRQLICDAGYIGPSLAFSGVFYILPGLTAARWNEGGGYVGVSWIFWFANLEWRTPK